MGEAAFFYKPISINILWEQIDESMPSLQVTPYFEMTAIIQGNYLYHYIVAIYKYQFWYIKLFSFMNFELQIIYMYKRKNQLIKKNGENLGSIGTIFSYEV